MGRVVKKNRNGGLWTEARYWQQVRSFLRKAFRFWKPATDSLERSKRIYEGENKRQKWEYQCNKCKEYFPRKTVQIDHKIPVGSLKGEEDLIAWLRRLTPEDTNAYQVLCSSCHKMKSLEERKK